MPLDTTIDKEEAESCDDIDLSSTDCGTGKSVAKINVTTTYNQRQKD